MRAQTTEIFLTEKWGTLEAVKKKITKNQHYLYTYISKEKMQKAE